MVKVKDLLGVRSKVRKKTSSKPVDTQQGDRVRAKGITSIAIDSGNKTRRFPGSEGQTVGSYLAVESTSMDRKRRSQEQQGHRRFAKVHAREHPDEESHSTPEDDLQNSIRQHPLLDSQKNDGTDNGLNPEPPLNTEARREFDNNRNEQQLKKELKKQLDMGYAPGYTAPKPSPK